MLITGLRGVGKTVLLNTFEGIAKEMGFSTASSEITHGTAFRGLIARLARRALLSVSPLDSLKDRAKRAVAVFKAFKLRVPDGGPEITIDIAAALGQADSGDLGEDLADLFVALGEAAAEQETGVVFLLDEIQFLGKEELEALIAAIHRVSQRALPVTLVGAGLPQLPQLAGEAKSYAERLFDFPKIGSLSAEAARRALEEPATKEEARYAADAIEGILRFTEGYPYFLQEYGRQVWNIAAGPAITAADVAAAQRAVELELDSNFFAVRVARCTGAELDYLKAMASLGRGPYRSGEIATTLGKAGAPNVAPTRARLIEKGLIFSPDHGLNEFTVPQFDDFMRRNHPWRGVN
jgi:hypothetical protein